MLWREGKSRRTDENEKPHPDFLQMGRVIDHF